MTFMYDGPIFGDLCTTFGIQLYKLEALLVGHTCANLEDNPTVQSSDDFLYKQAYGWKLRRRAANNLLF
jgi:hypothetical protein